MPSESWRGTRKGKTPIYYVTKDIINSIFEDESDRASRGEPSSKRRRRDPAPQENIHDSRSKYSEATLISQDEPEEETTKSELEHGKTTLVGEDEFDEDDEIIAGPQENEETNNKSRYGKATNTNRLRYTFGTEEKFIAMLRRLFQDLAKGAKALDFETFKALPRNKRPYPRRVWKFFTKTIIEVALYVFIAAIQLDVQKCLSKYKWSVEDLPSLSTLMAAQDRKGVYALFPSGNLEKAPEVGCEVYAGTSRSLSKRVLSTSSSSGSHTYTASIPLLSKHTTYLG